MRLAPLLAIALLSCARRGGALDAGSPDSGLAAPVDAGVARPAAPSRVTLPDAPFSLAWIAEVDEVPQVVVDGRFLTSGPAHYLGAVTASGLYATRSEGGGEQLVFVSFDGGTREVGQPSARAKAVTTAAGVALYESGEGGLSNLVTDTGRVVIDDPAGSFEPSLSPDGRWFAFVSSRDGDAEVYRANLDGGQLERLTAFHLDDVTPKVSPDGRWIAFISNREGSDRLFLVKPDGRGQRRLHRDESVDTRWDAGAVEAAEADHVWTPDSKAVVFSARSAGGRWHLFRADVASGARTRLTDGAHDDQLPAVSPDGAWVAFVSNRDGDAELYALGPDGGVLRVTQRVGADWKPLWLPRQGGGTGPR